ncbi:Uncharacterised protein [Mycobacteroides abscessus subsp. abscessus]|nr:Uncharacterised protein [Mycobacteroides abscessus subsp. abscessus]
MQVEDVTGVRLAARRTTQQQRDGAVGLGLLGQVVEHDQNVLALVHPVLTEGGAGVRGQPLEAGGVGGRGGDDGGVFQSAGLVQGASHGGDGGTLLADGDVDAAHLLSRITGLPGLLLVQDGVDADRRLAGLAVADDQLTLTAADRSLRIDRLDAGLQWLRNTLTLDHARGLELEGTTGLGFDVAAAVDRLAQWVDDAAEEGVADGHREHFTGALDLLAFFDVLEVTEDNGADAALVEVQRHAQHATGELEEFLGHHGGQTLDVGDAVTGVGDDADFFAGGVGRERRDVLLDRAGDIRRGDRQLCHGFSSSCSSIGVGLMVVSWADVGRPRKAGWTGCRRSPRHRC